MMSKTRLALVGLIAMAWSDIAEAALIPITGYDVTDASISGTGGWSHSYTGTITPTGGHLADYSGGTGTMADGIIGISESAAQLFCTLSSCGSASPPVTAGVTFFLDGSHTIDSIEIFGGDFGRNSIPGAITAFDVTVSGTSRRFTSAPFGAVGNSGQPVNDRVTILGSVLAGLATNQVTLSNFFTLEGGNPNRGRFSIAEVRIFGSPASAVPEPAALTLVGIGLAGIGLVVRRRRAAA